jgi:proteasome lid subunit RPN8/RPN11
VIELTPKQRDSMIAHARLLRDHEECCGFLVGNGSRVSHVIWMENLEHSPLNYRVDPLIYQIIQDGLDAQREQGYRDDIIGFYHSHTHSEAWPSRTDIEIARPNWAGYHQIIISLKDPENPVLRAFVIDRDGNVTPEEVILR